MFERYTESARKTLFFARYEASQTGSRAIETAHLLLGLLREVRGVVATIFDEAHASADEMRGEIKRRIVFGERFPPSVEIPFSAATKRVLERAAEEADRLLHSYIGTEHLLLALIAENRDSIAAQVLETQGGQRSSTEVRPHASTRADHPESFPRRRRCLNVTRPNHRSEWRSHDAHRGKGKMCRCLLQCSSPAACLLLP